MSARGAAACAFLLASTVALAQSPRVLRLEGGAAQIRQKERTARAAGVFGGLWRVEGPRVASLASAAFTWAGDSATAAQGIVAAAWRPTVESAWHTEGGVTASAFGVYALGRGGNQSAYARERVVLDDGGFWAGGAAGHTTRDGRSWHSTVVDVGAFLRSGGLETSVAFARLRTNDWPLMQASGIFLETDAAAHDLDDVTLAMRYARGALALDASHTWRGGARKTLARQTAFLWSAAYELSPRYAVIVGGGRQLADAVRGVPDAMVASAVLRVVLFPWRADAAERATARSSARVEQTAEGAVLVVRVAVNDSARVEVAGSFSGWEPVPLQRTSEGWEARVPLGPGTHRVAVRLGGGPWRAPRNLGKVRDEYGGEAGIVVVP